MVLIESTMEEFGFECVSQLEMLFEIGFGNEINVVFDIGSVIGLGPQLAMVGSLFKLIWTL